MTRFLLDTTTVIHIRAGRQAVIDRFETLAAGEALMSVVSYGELLFGAEKSRQRDLALTTLQRIAESIPVDPLPLRAAPDYAVMRADLERRGQMISANDLWIAAHARSANLTLVTANEREFRRVPGLAVENWTARA